MGVQLIPPTRFFTLLQRHVRPSNLPQLTALLPLAEQFVEYIPVCARICASLCFQSAFKAHTGLRVLYLYLFE